MPRRKAPSDATKNKQGRGSGHGKDYIPYDKIREVSSYGLSHRAKSHTIDRGQEHLSTLENNIASILDWARLEAREQFPLPLEETMSIADRLRIAHPRDPYTKEPWVIRIDLLVTMITASSTKLFAINAKLAKALESKRQIEKFEIERTYCAENGIGWGIVTEKEILNSLIENIKWVQKMGNLGNMPELRSDDLAYYESALKQEFIATPQESLSKACISTDKKLGLQPGTALWLVQHFIATHRWHINMLEKIDTAAPVSNLKIVSTIGEPEFV